MVETQHAPNADLWVYDIVSGAGTRLAPHPEDDTQPIWSPDGRQIAFASRRSRPTYSVNAVRADGSAAPRLLVENPREDVWVLQWLKGDAFLLGRGQFQAGVDNPLWWHPLDGGRPRLLIPPSPGCTNAQVSPDGRWLAFDSRVSGRSEIYVAPMQTPGTAADSSAGLSGRWQVSAAGGLVPVWSRDGQELFYKRPDDTMIAVTVKGRGETFRASSERPLFQAFQRGLVPTYDTSDDGRFLVICSSIEHQAPLVVVTNWTQMMRAR